MLRYYQVWRLLARNGSWKNSLGKSLSIVYLNGNNQSHSEIFIKHAKIRSYCDGGVAISCQSCKKIITGKDHLYCPHCSALQELDVARINYFDLFGLPQNYSLESTFLKRTFLRLQSRLHPDRSSPSERALSEVYSSLVNEAYQTLNDPLKRGLYLLKLRGVHFEESDTKSDLEFLAGVMRFNEALELVSAPNQLKELERENERHVDYLTAEVASAFADNDLGKAKLRLAQLKFYYSNNVRIKAKKIELQVTD